MVNNSEPYHLMYVCLWHLYRATKNGKGDHGLLIGGLPADSDEEADNDSMEDYSQMDPTKFNEDGSFIGQYGGHRRGVEVDASNHSPQV